MTRWKEISVVTLRISNFMYAFSRFFNNWKSCTTGNMIDRVQSLTFTARRYASAVLAVVMCLCVCLFVCLSVRLSQAGIVSKRLQIGPRKQCHTIAQGL